MRELMLTAEILQNNILLYTYGRGGCKVKAMICPTDGGFQAFVWEGDGKTSNRLDDVHPTVPSTAGFKPVHEGVIKNALGCLVVIDAYFEKTGKRAFIKLLDVNSCRDEIAALGLTANFTNQGVFYANKETVKKTRSVPRIRRWLLRLSDKVSGFGEKKVELALTKEQIANLEESLARMP